MQKFLATTFEWL